MTLELSNSPGKPEIRTWYDNVVHMRDADSRHDIEIIMSDFVHAMYYVLTNAPMEKDDPRLKFIEIVKALEFTGDGRGLIYKGRECFSLVYPGDYKK